MFNMWSMAGTDKTGQYLVVAVTNRGRVGFRELGGSWSMRIRIEPNDKQAAELMKPQLSGWSQPVAGNLRFSCMVGSEAQAKAAMLAAKQAICCWANDLFNPAAPAWVVSIFEGDADPGQEPSFAELYAEAQAKAKAKQAAKLADACAALFSEAQELAAKLKKLRG